MAYDVIVVGGSYAGLSAAMQLARARRTVLVIDAGLPRNRFAAEGHGFLGQDGRAPRDILRDAIRQLQAYPTFTLRHGEATGASGQEGAFTVSLADGTQEQGARLILATGVSDELPPIAGMKERWGVTVLHCPYCHGYEVADQPLGVVAAHPLSVHQAALIPDWGPTTYFTQGLFEPTADEAAGLEARGVTIERSSVSELLGTSPALEGVRLADGRTVPVAALFVASMVRPASPLAGILGCAMTDAPMGAHVQVDDWKQTSVPGVYAAGDAAAMMHNATLASAAGVMAGVGAHRSLLGL